MAFIHYFTILTSLLLLLNRPDSASATTRKLAALVRPPPLTLKYHNGPLLNGNVTVSLLWYGKFSPTQRSIIADFIQSLNAPHAPTPSVASWWQTTERYKFGSGSGSTVILGSQILDENYSLGKSLTTSQIIELASKSQRKNSIHVVLTAEDVTVDGFCMSRCGIHGSGFSDPKNKREKFAYAWTPPLVAPNGDVGVDGMVINLATVLTGTVTNPFNNGYFQGPETAPLEAVTACTGMFGSGSYPGYAGSVLVDKSTGASYNSQGVNGRKYLLPAMWDPKTSTCKTLV
ncbi:EXORDIUM like 2 [Actinidia rufa]|uniref:EXORDIUM like 2 n=1 Tax=Actinidia rufa TaxID=165716 RepID=A0A7J0E1X8_9ERIC|nr:EXORDIUM like 2 [Actinidia rufa]